MGTLILRRLRRLQRAIRVSIIGQGKLFPLWWLSQRFCPYCASPLCPFDLLTSPQIEENYAVLITPQPITLTLRRLQRGGSVPY